MPSSNLQQNRNGLKTSKEKKSNPARNMFEARLQSADVLKQLVEAMRDLVTSANLDCSATGISLQVRCAERRASNGPL